MPVTLCSPSRKPFPCALVCEHAHLPQDQIYLKMQPSVTPAARSQLAAVALTMWVTLTHSFPAQRRSSREEAQTLFCVRAREKKNLHA